MQATGLTLLGLVAIAYALVASRLERWSVGGPLVMTAAGLVLGPAGLAVLQLPASSEPVKLATEVTLAMLLFADASTIGLRRLTHHAGLPLRLLAVGLPLTIVLGTVVAHGMLDGSTWAAAALVATILAPTDAALSLPVVSNPKVPPIVRTTLNVESGLNDGIATPVVTVLIAVVASEESATAGWLGDAGKAIAVAVAVAAVVGAGGALLALRARRDRWTTPLSDELAVLLLALVSYSGAVALGGNGFVSSFVAGLVFGAVTRHRVSRAVEYTETTGLFMSYAVWALFGAALAGPLLEDGWHASALAYALVSLTVIRMVPVAIALLGARTRVTTTLFIGWFGPRGLASVVFLILAAHELHIGAQGATGVLAETVVWTILLSVVLHGLTAAPLSAWFGRRSGTEHTTERGVAGADGQAAATAPVRRRRLGLSHRDDGRA
ncbi:cation:proton antiporter [Xylanimonas sp. McL0601]|uniref:cation:proton antiporter n=1 Tax=Xylanimonas sp. McL0601 TaxID=3414739 RepID=UPI003CF55ADF